MEETAKFEQILLDESREDFSVRHKFNNLLVEVPPESR